MTHLWTPPSSSCWGPTDLVPVCGKWYSVFPWNVSGTGRDWQRESRSEWWESGLILLWALWCRLDWEIHVSSLKRYRDLMLVDVLGSMKFLLDAFKVSIFFYFFNRKYSRRNSEYSHKSVWGMHYLIEEDVSSARFKQSFAAACRIRTKSMNSFIQILTNIRAIGWWKERFYYRWVFILQFDGSRCHYWISKGYWTFPSTTLVLWTVLE